MGTITVKPRDLINPIIHEIRSLAQLVKRIIYAPLLYDRSKLILLVLDSNARLNALVSKLMRIVFPDRKLRPIRRLYASDVTHWIHVFRLVVNSVRFENETYINRMHAGWALYGFSLSHYICEDLHRCGRFYTSSTLREWREVADFVASIDIYDPRVHLEEFYRLVKNVAIVIQSLLYENPETLMTKRADFILRHTEPLIHKFKEISTFLQPPFPCVSRGSCLNMDMWNWYAQRKDDHTPQHVSYAHRIFYFISYLREDLQMRRTDTIAKWRDICDVLVATIVDV